MSQNARAFMAGIIISGLVTVASGNWIYGCAAGISLMEILRRREEASAK